MLYLVLSPTLLFRCHSVLLELLHHVDICWSILISLCVNNAQLHVKKQTSKVCIKIRIFSTGDMDFHSNLQYFTSDWEEIFANWPFSGISAFFNDFEILNGPFLLILNGPFLLILNGPFLTFFTGYDGAFSKSMGLKRTTFCLSNTPYRNYELSVKVCI